MKIFLPFTINLDPYIKKKIKEEQQTMDEESNHPSMYKWNNSMSSTGGAGVAESGWINRSSAFSRPSRMQKPNTSQLPPGSTPGLPQMPPIPNMWPPNVRPLYDWQMPHWPSLPPPMEPIQKPLSAVTNLPVGYFELPRINEIFHLLMSIFICYSRTFWTSSFQRLQSMDCAICLIKFKISIQTKYHTIKKLLKIITLVVEYYFIVIYRN